MQSQENPMSSEPLSGTSLETDHILMPLIREMFIQQLREFVGPSWDGRTISSEIKILPKVPSIGTTPTGLCVKSLVTEVIMVANLKLSPLNLNCRLEWSETFSQNISPPSPPTSDGNDGFRDRSIQQAILPL